MRRRGSKGTRSDGGRREAGAFGCRSRRRRKLVLLATALLLLLCLAILPVTASAESLCTDSWSGPAEGEWATAADWSAGRVPNSSDVACIGSGKTVTIGGGSQEAAVVQGEGTVAVSAGTLDVLSVLEVSSVHALKMTGGTLGGAGTIDVSGSFSGASFATMAGSGATVILAGATASLNGFYLEESRVFVNEGTATLESGAFHMYGTSKVENAGMLESNSEGSPPAWRVGSGSPVIVNSGVFEKTSGSSWEEIAVPFENEGTLKAESGALRFGSEPPRKSWRRFLLSGLSRSCLLVLDGGEFVAAAV
jgi:hypothetical protein